MVKRAESSDDTQAIVVKQRPIMQAPAEEVSADQADAAGAPLLKLPPTGATDKAISRPVRKQIKPLTQTAKTTDIVDTPKAEAATASDNDASTAANEGTNVSEISKPETAAPESVKEPQPNNEEVDKQEAALAAKIDDLVTKKTYFLPINALERRRSAHVVTAGFILIILLALAWLDLAADAGFIHVPFLPVTHFFRI